MCVCVCVRACVRMRQEGGRRKGESVRKRDVVSGLPSHRAVGADEVGERERERESKRERGREGERAREKQGEGEGEREGGRKRARERAPLLREHAGARLCLQANCRHYLGLGADEVGEGHGRQPNVRIVLPRPRSCRQPL